MSIKIPKTRKPEVEQTPEQKEERKKALTKFFGDTFKPGAIHRLPVSGAKYVVDENGSWRRKR